MRHNTSPLPSINEVRDCLQLILVDLRGGGDLDLFEAKIIDSLKLVETVVHLEEAFLISFDHNHLNASNFRTLEKIHATICELLVLRVQ